MWWRSRKITVCQKPIARSLPVLLLGMCELMRAYRNWNEIQAPVLWFSQWEGEGGCWWSSSCGAGSLGAASIAASCRRPPGLRIFLAGVRDARRVLPARAAPRCKVAKRFGGACDQLICIRNENPPALGGAPRTSPMPVTAPKEGRPRTLDISKK